MAIQHSNSSSSLGDLLDRILDKGVVIAGDIKISLADVELLNIKIRLLVASVDKAREMGIDWWESDPYLSSRARTSPVIESKTESAALIEAAPVKEQVELKDPTQIKETVEVRQHAPYKGGVTIKAPVTEGGIG